MSWDERIHFAKETRFIDECSLETERILANRTISISFHRISVRVGEHDTKTSPDCKTIKTSGKPICAPPVQEISVEESIAHPDYDSRDKRRRYNDVALVRLQRPVQFHGKYHYSDMNTSSK